MLGEAEFLLHELRIWALFREWYFSHRRGRRVLEDWTWFWGENGRDYSRIRIITI